MHLKYKQLMQIRRLTIHDGFVSEKRDFILIPLSDREPVKIFELRLETRVLILRFVNFILYYIL